MVTEAIEDPIAIFRGLLRPGLRTAGDFGIIVEDGEVQLGLFFFIGAVLAKDESQKNRYEELRQKTKNVALDRSELQLVC